MEQMNVSSITGKFILLSDLIKQIPERPLLFIKHIRRVIIDGSIEGVQLVDRFDLPYTIKRKGEEVNLRAFEIIFENTPENQAFLNNLIQEVKKLPRFSARGVTIETLKRGVHNFDELCNRTRQKMKMSEQKGRTMGSLRRRRVSQAA